MLQVKLFLKIGLHNSRGLHILPSLANVQIWSSINSLYKWLRAKHWIFPHFLWTFKKNSVHVCDTLNINDDKPSKFGISIYLSICHFLISSTIFDLGRCEVSGTGRWCGVANCYRISKPLQVHDSPFSEGGEQNEQKRQGHFLALWLANPNWPWKSGNYANVLLWTFLKAVG